MGKFPIRIFTDGHQAVILFFILSGLVLTLPFSRNRQIQYPRFLIRRVCRIYLPYLAALALALLGAWKFHGTPASAVGWSDSWLHSIWSEPLRKRLVWEHICLIGNYHWGQYNPIFWSLIYEMRISLIFPFMAVAILRMPTKWAIFCALIMSLATKPLAMLFAPVFYIDPEPMTRIASQTFFTLHYTSFLIVGAVFSKHLGQIQKTFDQLTSKSRFLLLMAALILYDGLNITHSHGPIAAFDLLLFFHGQLEDWLTCAGALLLIGISLASASSNKVLSHAALRHIGRISYSMYLVHGTILFTMVRLLHRPSTFVVALLVYVPITLGVTEVFYRLVEKPAMDLGHRITTKRNPQIQLVPAVVDPLPDELALPAN